MTHTVFEDTLIRADLILTAYCFHHVYDDFEDDHYEITFRDGKKTRMMRSSNEEAFDAFKEWVLGHAETLGQQVTGCLPRGIDFCPFPSCNNPTNVTVHKDNTCNAHMVECLSCGTRGPICMGRPKKAIRAWNELKR